MAAAQPRTSGRVSRPGPQPKGDCVLDKIREGLTYSNVMATLAVFIALGGSSYAALTISGSDIKNRSIAGKKLRKNTLTGGQPPSRFPDVPRLCIECRRYR